MFFRVVVERGALTGLRLTRTRWHSIIADLQVQKILDTSQRLLYYVRTWADFRRMILYLLTEQVH